ncbi:MAG: hypothetical protein HRT88_01295 [Lentisphaeraceae bacterium]|nr:hypothetical protein [Lentisphaeraceae bacterium]
MGNHELTEMLIHALENSQVGFDSFKESFQQCASAFEIGNDQEGVRVLTELIDPLKGFSRFCADMIGSHVENIPEELFNELGTQCETFQNLLADILEEMESSNFVEVGDILKYDLGDLISSMSESFPTIALALRKSVPQTQE